MKCLQIEAPGEPSDVLKCRDVSSPSPGTGEVLVRMLASPINPSDMMFIRGIYGTQPQLPQIPGFEGVGFVEASGGGLRGRLLKGRRVAVLNKAGGNWAERAVVPSEQVIPLSSRLSVEQAATFFVNPATAWIMVNEVLRVPKGAWLLQTAASSSLGRMVIRLGQEAGFRTLNVVRRNTAIDELKAAGATEVIVFDGETDSAESLLQDVSQTVGTDGLRHAIDPVGGATASAVVQTLAAGGRLVLFGTLTDSPIEFSPRTLMKQQGTVEGFWLGNFMKNRSLLYKLKLVKRITRLILKGTLASDIADSFPLEQFQDALAAAERSGRHGKSLLKISSE